MVNLGDNSITCKCTPVAVYGNHTFCQISGGQNHSIGIDHDGQLWSWGYNLYGQLGIETPLTPVLITI
jgi:alpha-tubulin suppressor-like RCC1 family protein